MSKYDISCGFSPYYVLYKIKAVSYHSSFRDKFTKAREVEALDPNHTTNTQDKHVGFHQSQPSSATITQAAWQLQALSAQHGPGPVLWVWYHLI